jgi:hypothetical protein
VIASIDPVINQMIGVTKAAVQNSPTQDARRRREGQYQRVLILPNGECGVH